MCVCKRGQYKSFWIRMQENQMLFWRKDSIVGVDGKRKLRDTTKQGYSNLAYDLSRTVGLGRGEACP